MNETLSTMMKSAVLVGTALMFYSKISTGTLTYYINQRFVWLPYVALLIVLMLALTLIYQLMRRPKLATAHAHHHDHHHHDHHDHDHGHDHTHNASWLTIALLSLPMLFGLLAPTKPLGTGALGSRSLAQAAPAREAAGSRLSAPAKGEKNIMDWLREFSRSSNLNSFVGQPIDVIGFVYKDPKVGAGRFWVARFTVSCCVADASAIGMLVQADGTANGLKDLQNDQWVRVTGKISIGEFDGEQVPVISASKIEPTATPENPYLQP